MRRKYILSFCFGGVVFVLLLVLLSRLVEPKYTDIAREGNLIAEYYRETDAGHCHDVVFIGDCEAYSSFAPPVIYERYGIRSFVRGSPSQSVAQSYYLLREALKYETPDAVVFSVYAMCKGEKPTEAYNRLTLDGMRLSAEKIGAVQESANDGEMLLSYYLPLLRFHSRVFELKEDDLKYLFSRPLISHNGYLMEKRIAAPDREAEDYAAAVEALPKKNMEYLEKMRQECERRGVELILVKAPISSWRYPWYDKWDSELSEYAEQHGLSYYNLIESSEEIGIDMLTDSYDGGLHLNVRGAEKTSLFFGKLLAKSHGIDGERNDIWEEKLRKYYNERDNE